MSDNSSTRTPTRFIVIDDNLVNNMLCQIVLNEFAPESDIQTFNIPEKGFEYIVNEYVKTEKERQTVLFLDINMPTWSGWDFLKEFEKLADRIKRQFRIYLLSSSVDSKDEERAHGDKNVVDYIIKPLNEKMVSGILTH